MEHPTPPTRAVCAVVFIRVAVVKCLAVLCICVHARLEAHRVKKKTGPLRHVLSVGISSLRIGREQHVPDTPLNKCTAFKSGEFTDTAPAESP